MLTLGFFLFQSKVNALKTRWEQLRHALSCFCVFVNRYSKSTIELTKNISFLQVFNEMFCQGPGVVVEESDQEVREFLNLEYFSFFTWLCLIFFKSPSLLQDLHDKCNIFNLHINFIKQFYLPLDLHVISTQVKDIFLSFEGFT